MWNPLDVLPNPLHLLGKLNSVLGHGAADLLDATGLTSSLVDPDGVREIARRWTALSQAVAQVSWDAGAALDGLRWDGNAAEAFAERALLTRRRADDVCAELDAGAAALNQFADEAHEVIAQIGVLAVEIAEFQAAATAVALFTAGLSEGAAAAATAERVSRVGFLVVRIEEAARRMARTLAALVESVAGIERAIAALGRIGRMALAGAGSAVAWDALFQPERFTDLDTLAQDAGAGALLGVAFGASGRAIAALGRSVGDGAGTKLAAVGVGGARLDDGVGPAGGDGVLYRYEEKWTRHGPKPSLVRRFDL